MILKSMEVKMEYKKIVKLLSVIIFSLIMSNSVLGADADTHKKLMERHRSALKDSQAALKEHREKFPHLQEPAEEAYRLHQRTVEDLIAQILVENHGKNHVATPTQITLATTAAHIKASQAPSIPFLGIKGNMELDPLNGQRYSQTPVESQGSREATSVYMSDEDGENSSVQFDGN